MLPHPLVKMFYDGFVKSPDAALRCILPRIKYGAGLLRRTTSTPHSSGLARLACGSFYKAVYYDQLYGFMRDRQSWKRIFFLKSRRHFAICGQPLLEYCVRPKY